MNQLILSCLFAYRGRISLRFIRKLALGCTGKTQRLRYATWLTAEAAQICRRLTNPHSLDCLNLRTRPPIGIVRLSMFAKGEPVPLVLLDDPAPFRDMVLETLNAAGIPGGRAYVALHITGGTARPPCRSWRNGSTCRNDESRPSRAGRRRRITAFCRYGISVAAIPIARKRVGDGDFPCAMESYQNPWHKPVFCRGRR